MKFQRFEMASIGDVDDEEGTARKTIALGC
jgi:hypothetical protein